MAKKKAAVRKTSVEKPEQQTAPPPPTNELAVLIAATQEANAQAHQQLLDQRLAVIEHKRMALAAEPAVPAEKRPL